MVRVPNPLQALLLTIGRLLVRLGLISEDRVRQTVDLAWPRILTGIARMSKNAADVAMVGVALGPAAIAGVGFAGPYWGVAFSIGGGLAAGTIALVSQRFGAERIEQAGQAIRSSAVLVVAITLPLAAAFWTVPTALISLLTDDPQAIEYGATYLHLVGPGVPFAALNLIGSRALIGVDDAWTPMVLRGTGAVVNVGLNAVLIFGLGLGVVGAALGTVLSNVFVTVGIAIGLANGRLPGVGAFPITVSPTGRYVHRETIRDVVEIGTPVVGRNSVWMVARFPALAFVGMFGSTVVAAYIITRRIWGLMNTPGWGFGLAASSLVGQELGRGEEETAAAFGREITIFSVATYMAAAGIVVAFAPQIVGLFVGGSGDLSIPIAVGMVYASALAIIPQGVAGATAGALDATGDTRWPFYSRALGMFGVSIPLIYLGGTTSLGIVGIYLSFFGETLVPALVNYHRFASGKWKAISRGYRPERPE
ncbi:MATE family efflux transporter [Halanaeroarchaeum sulfurireducens]|uniref:Multidrug-efflux transporter n=1 Tax=Halanaeroarchaeum sulfurireducens TaxID=1604004 RepID=A0A0F7PFI9_9EURY|nr:MATE family efflux transporter [Halanaeroarchaeum sulfurireducens]AKH98299.1 DMT family permease [Halanaeroarchaeum sulfurireducens]ALG82693.1 DMT family permease [Halanaeroarchaeum sulfurireducens]